VSAAAGEKTESATPKKRDEARKKGTVAKSTDVNGVAVLLAGFGMLAALGPMMFERLQESMRHLLGLMATPSVVEMDGLGALFGELGTVVAMTVGPIAGACLVAGLIANVAQVKWKMSFKAIKPDPRKLNPMAGAKNLLGKRAWFELVKNLLKVAVVSAVVFMVVTPQMDDLASLVGMPPGALMVELAKQTLSLGFRACAAYLFIAVADYGYQRYSTEKSLKMTKDEVKQEHKGQEASAEVRGARKRRQMEGARARMMQDVPEADVVVTNPTHYSVALKYDSEKAAPVVIAKGKDIIAFKIRDLARQNGVPVVPDPPLARSLHASVEVGQMIPEEMYQAVAQLLAFVYRTAGRRRQLQAVTPTSDPIAA
jgi:flagellar biosynthetic protein FlhB